ncbi:TetR/AcrR family transcriptional regulator [Photobacterium alginatilyticum]|uniref:TetR/AcrR family transcriptional regulator n=1 Tax=Photobacterium alginatilyticum TaxID=1775171 RepID=A0ABW9YH06_9GAMM|nr:TetR/AcrR family transcriptional regulator [Photobacterium alginatilyticum]NBI53056.1 TetR/AcrR family transcriptional regulator [Photobacterium alginatilyticum]
MARSKNFDREEKLLLAMELFWQKGYAETSVADLVNHLGINRFSLYNTYTDKESLYREALDYYLKKISFPMLSDSLSADAGYQDIVAYLTCFADLQREQKCGCFMQNAILERAYSDDDVLEAGSLLYQTLSDSFKNAIENAQRREELNTSVEPARLSHFLVMQMQGIRVLGKARQYEMIDDALSVLLTMLDGQKVSGACE